MKLIGISGKKRSGKDTVCQRIIETLGYNRARRVAFADEVKVEVAAAIKESVEYVEENKDKLRLLLQAWGTDYRRNLCGPDYWVARAFNNVLKLPPSIHTVIIPDVRFISEAEAIHRVDGLVIRVESIRSPKDGHVSENELDNYGKFDYTLQNDGTLEDFYQQINKLINEKIYVHTKKL